MYHRKLFLRPHRQTLQHDRSSLHHPPNELEESHTNKLHWHLDYECSFHGYPNHYVHNWKLTTQFTAFIHIGPVPWPWLAPLKTWETLSKPSCLQATRPASMFHPLSQIVPQWSLKKTSILPVYGLLPAIRNEPSVKTLREKRTRYQLIYDLIEMSINYSIARSRIC